MADDEEHRDVRRYREHSSLTREQVRQMELRDAELFGVDSKGGKFAALEKLVMIHDEKIERLETFRIKMIVWGSVLVTVGGILAGIASRFIDRL